MYVALSQSPLLSHLASLCGGLGIAYQTGEEAGFLSSLYREGLRERDIFTVNRLLNGRPVKLDDYRDVVNGVSRLRDGKMAAEAIKELHQNALDRLFHCHDRVMSSLQERGLTATFVDFAFTYQFVIMHMGYEAGGGCRDVSFEFRHFVEDRGFLDLYDLANEYARGSGEAGQWKKLLETCLRNR